MVCAKAGTGLQAVIIVVMAISISVLIMVSIIASFRNTNINYFFLAAEKSSKKGRRGFRAEKPGPTRL